MEIKNKSLNNRERNVRERGWRGRISVCLKSWISFTRGGENMEQPSLLLQLSSSLYQLNMAVDYTGGGEEKEREQTEGEHRI